jgi:hypothetical protein
MQGQGLNGVTPPFAEPERARKTEPGATRSRPPDRPPAPPGTASQPPGRPDADEIPLDYLAIVLCGNDPRWIWRCLEPLDPPHTCRGGRRWFRRSLIVPWIRGHQAEIRREAERLGARFTDSDHPEQGDGTDP